MLGTIFEKLKSVEAKRVQSDSERWLAIVRSVADGKAKDPDKVAKELSELGRSVAELESAVQKLTERRRLIEVAGKKSQAENDIQNASAEREQEELRFEKVTAEHEKIVGAIIDRRDSAVRRLSDADSALRRLREMTPAPKTDPNRDARIFQLESDLSALQKQEQDKSNWVATVSGFGSGADFEDLRRLDGQKNALRNLRTEIQEKLTELHSLHAAMEADLRAAMMNPDLIG